MMVAKQLREVANGAGYPLEALLFVERGLDFTVRQVHGEPPEDRDADDAGDEGSGFADGPAAGSPNRHVTGHDLCYGLRDYAVEQYGLMARAILRRWRITSCHDFGRIVFAMVESGLMQKTDDDRLDDFADVFEFADAFDHDLLLAE